MPTKTPRKLSKQPPQQPPRDTAPKATGRKPDPVVPKRFATAAQRRFAVCRAPLLDWFQRQARALPWRAPFVPGAGDGPAFEGDVPRRPPYAVWVSEIMLQQTQVAAVVAHFEHWMRLFPSVAVLASAPEERVLQAWAGLGYYARARNLHRGAKVLAARKAWPDSVREWREVPGVGEYTAGAIASIAFERRAPVLDGNVIRVFSRLLGLGFLPGAGTVEKKAYWELARLWADAPRPGELNEALMELGALVCVPAAPRCVACPLADACSAKRHGWQGILPPVKQRPAPERVTAVAVVATLSGRGQQVLVEERGRGAFLAGHTMFPLFLGSESETWRAAFQRRFPGWTLTGAKSAGRLRHAIMSKRYDVEVWSVLARRSPASRAAAGEVLRLSVPELPERLTNALARKIWAVSRGG